MFYEDALKLLDEGKKIRLPEWRSYWFKDGDKIKALTMHGEIVHAWVNDKGITNRLDWSLAMGLDFGWAICALKAGKLVTRKGMSGFVFMRPADSIPERIVIDNVKSVPQKFKNYLSSNPIEFDNGGDLYFTGYFCHFDGKVNNGWMPSINDILDEDWDLVEGQNQPESDDLNDVLDSES